MENTNQPCTKNAENDNQKSKNDIFMRGKNPDLSVVVPVYNEEGNVRELHRKIVEACQALGKTFEVVFIDDGSTDKTNEICRTLSPLKLIVQRKNFGQTAAFDAGFKNSTGRVVITLDGDLQNDPADIGKLLEKMDEGFDVVSGWRKDRKDKFLKKINSRMANLLRKVLIDDGIQDSGCSLKAYKRECFDDLDLFGEMHRFIPAMLKIQGFKVGEIPVTHHPRKHGVTKYNWKRGVKGIVDMVSVWFWKRYASRPLHLFGGGGLFVFGVGFLITAVLAVAKFGYGVRMSDKNWPLVAVFLLLTGIQLFIFGLLADIATKNYYKAHGEMNYKIKEIVEN